MTTTLPSNSAPDAQPWRIKITGTICLKHGGVMMFNVCWKLELKNKSGDSFQRWEIGWLGWRSKVSTGHRLCVNETAPMESHLC